MSLLSTEQPSTAEPPAPGAPNVGLMVGWGAVLLVTVGVFYATASGRFAAPEVRPNRKKRRRTSRRRSTRRKRSTRRRSSRRSKRPKRNKNGRYLITRSRQGRREYTAGPGVTGAYSVVSRPDSASTFRSRAAAEQAMSRASLRGGWKVQQAVTPNRRRYKSLSASARKRMPESSFALSGRRFPIKGPRGSSRERDKWQAMQAIRYLTMGRVKNRADYLAVRSAIIREYGPNFWREHSGPTWPQIEKAKRRRSSTRSRRRTSRRKVAANRKRRRTSRRR